MKSARAAALLALALAAPACYSGSAHAVPPNSLAALARDPAWQVVPDVPFVPQRTTRDCGPAALAMVLAHFRAALPAEEDHPELARGDVAPGRCAMSRARAVWTPTSCLGRSMICSPRWVAAGRWWWGWRNRWR